MTSPSPQPQRRGARTHQSRFSGRLESWKLHHRAMATDSLHRLLRHPLGSLLTMLAIAIALMLPAGLWLAMDSVRGLDAELTQSATMTVYLDQSVGTPEAERIHQAVMAQPDVRQTRLISPKEGLNELQVSLGLDNTLVGLDENPLPVSIVVHPGDVAPGSMQALAEHFAGMAGVDEVRLDLAWVERLRQITQLGDRLALGLGVLFGLGVLLVVGNTIRLAVESRRREIEVVMLIGATHAFVRRPFLYSGAWYGLGGGIIALVLLGLGGEWLSSPITSLAQSYGADFVMPSLGLGGSTILLSCSTLLGLMGAWLAVSRHLASIKPE